VFDVCFVGLFSKEIPVHNRSKECEHHIKGKN